MTVPDVEKQPLLHGYGGTTTETEQEPSLAELQQNVVKAQRAYMKAWHERTSSVWHRRIMYCVSTILILFFCLCMLVIAGEEVLGDDFPLANGKVALEAHIMSKCPDARDCLKEMILPAMQNISDKVDFKLSFIGTITDHDDGVQCMHGEEECLGNIIELCAAKVYPDPKIYLGFTMCLSKQYSDIPKQTLVEDCALEHGISMDKINQCTVQEDGELSVDMLQASFNRSAEAGVTTSCTVRLNGKTRCVRDGGEWKNCEGGSSAKSLVDDVLALANSTRWEY